MAWVMRTKYTRGQLQVSVGGILIATISVGRKTKTMPNPWYLNIEAPLLCEPPVKVYPTLSAAMSGMHEVLKADPIDTAYLTGDEQRARKASEGK